MKKNIIILGTGRAGKTTLAKMLNEELCYSVIGTDDIITAFERSMPQLNIGQPNDIKTTAANLAPFLAHFIGGLTYRSCCRNGTNCVFEGSGSHFDFEKMLPILGMYDEWKDNYLIIGLIYPGIAPDDLFNDIRKHDIESDWTYNLNDDQLRSHVISSIEYSRNFHDKFKKYNPVIYDVSKDRKSVLYKIVNDIKSYSKSEILLN